MRAYKAQRLAIGRKLKRETSIRIEISQSTARRAIQRLQPDVSDAVFCDVVSHGFPVGSDRNRRSKISPRDESFRGSLGIRAYVDKSNFDCGGLCGCVSDISKLRH